MGEVVRHLTEEQKMLKESAAQVLADKASMARYRELRENDQVYDAELWKELVELGWSAIPFSEDQGGLGLGLPEIAVVMEALGANLAKVPMLSVLLGGVLAPEAGAAEGKVVALAHQEGKGTKKGTMPTVFEAGRLNGEKRNVLDAVAADSFVVVVGSGDDRALYLVAADDCEVTALKRLDYRDAGHVNFDSAPATRLAATAADLDSALEQATVALAAEMLGGAQAAFAATLSYLKERVQFDKPIGSFQALQHRAVDCYIALELARSAVTAAAENPEPLNVSLAKTRANDAYLAVAKEAIQLHGGIGMTDEHDIGFHLKRAHVAGFTLGTSTQHRDRWGRLRGY